MIDPVAILELPGALAQASLNGVPFYMPNSREVVGRRVQQFFFPGVDAPQYQDSGAFQGPLRVQGLIVGDLYVQYVRSLRQVFLTAGALTLTHPWYGTLQVVLLQPAEIDFDYRRLRVATFRAEFGPAPGPAQGVLSTLDGVLQDVADASMAAQDFLAQALAPAATAVWLGTTVATWLGAAQGYWQSVTGATGTFGAPGNPQLAAAVAAPVAAIGTSPPAGSAYGTGVAAQIAAVPTAIARASATLQPPAVGPGDAAVAATPIDGRVTMRLLLNAAATAAAQFGAPGPPGALALAQAALCAVYAVEAATAVAWTSQQEAEAALAQMLGALDVAAAQAATLAVPTVATVPQAVLAGMLWTALQTTRADLRADMTAAIGRLPPVLTFALQRTTSAWAIANILAGDTPALIVPTYQDIIARNAVANPAMVPVGTVEVLAPAGIAALTPGALAA